MLAFCLNFLSLFSSGFLPKFPKHPTFLSTFIIRCPHCLISTVLPITPAGVGVGQVAIYQLYKLYTGIDSQIGPNAFTAFQVVLLCWGLFGAYFYVTGKKHI